MKIDQRIKKLKDVVFKNPIGKLSAYQKQMVKALKYLNRETEDSKKRIHDNLFMKELQKDLRVQCIRKKQKKSTKDLTD